jgi:hypothetical protein
MVFAQWAVNRSRHSSRHEVPVGLQFLPGFQILVRRDIGDAPTAQCQRESRGAHSGAKVGKIRRE